MSEYCPSIVIIARHFPPHISGGARRPYLFAEALKALGCRVHVMAPALPVNVTGMVVSHANADPSTSTPTRLTLRDFAREWLLWPDPDILWVRKCVRKAQGGLPFRPDWVFTTSPPESIHMAGLHLKRKFNCMWAADFRDLWLERPLRPSRHNQIRKIIESAIARKITKNANLLVAVNGDVKLELEGFSHRKDIALIEQASPLLLKSTFKLSDTTLNVVHTGSFTMSDPERSIIPVLTIFQAALSTTSKLHLHLAGRLSEDELKLIECSGISANITVHGLLDMNTTLAMQSAADAFILVGAAKAPSPPGKLAEYNLHNKPIIAIGEAEWVEEVNQGQNALAKLKAVQKRMKAESRGDIITPVAAARQLLKKMQMAEQGKSTL